MRAALLLLGLTLTLLSTGQVFLDHSSQQSVDLTNTGLWGGGVSTYDFNSDGWPDLSFARENYGITRFVNNNGTFTYHGLVGNQELIETEMALYADYDNDGDADLFVSNASGGSFLFKNINGELVDVTAEANLIQNPEAWTQGACWGDYDRDGYLDLYVCNYNWNVGIDNWLYHNNGDGTFTEIAQSLGVSNGSKPSFQAVFMDYNNDMWPDIFVINDRTPANAMYRNNGDGTFTDVSVPIGVDQTIDAMTASVCDYDKDGDQDIYVTNGPNGNLFLENMNGVFLNTAVGTPLEINQLCWGATWIDYNNNGKEDLYVCTEWPLDNNENKFYKNGLTGLSPNPTAFNGSNDFSAHSSAKADFNRDGKQDLVVQASEDDHARLFLNQGAAGNSVQIQLEGVVSNRDGVGSWVNSYIDGALSCVFTMSGGGYMAQDSQYITIGIGSNESLDLVEVIWPSGQVDTFSDLLPGSLIKLTEGSSETTSIVYQSTTFCEGDSIYLATSGGSSPVWNNGTEANGIWVDEAGDYSYVSNNAFNIPITSNTLSVSTAPDLVATSSTTNPSCFEANDGTIQCSIEPAPEGFTWSSGHTDLTIPDATEGMYTITYWNEIGCSFADTIELSHPTAINLTLSTTDIQCFGDNNGSVLYDLYGGTGELNLNSFGANLDSLEAGNYNLLVTDENGCNLESNFEIFGPDAIGVEPIITHEIGDELGSVELNTSGGQEPYSHYWSNGSQSEDIEELSAGVYFVTIEDNNGCLYNHQISIDQIVNISGIEQEKLFFAPNPASNLIQFSLNNEDYTLKIYSVNGQLLEEHQIQGNMSFSTENLSNGWYILYLYSSNAVHQAKMMVQH